MHYYDGKDAKDLKLMVSCEVAFRRELPSWLRVHPQILKEGMGQYRRNAAWCIKYPDFPDFMLERNYHLPKATLMHPKFAKTVRLYFKDPQLRNHHSHEYSWQVEQVHLLVQMFPPNSALRKLQIYIEYDIRYYGSGNPVCFHEAFEALSQLRRQLSSLEFVFGKHKTVAVPDLTQLDAELTRVAEAVLGEGIGMARVEEMIPPQEPRVKNTGQLYYRANTYESRIRYEFERGD
jgi:hypothetical protein